MSNTLVCSVELSKTAGVTIKVTNAQGKIVQTVAMDGTTLTITVEGNGGVTTVTQNTDSLELKVAGEQDTSVIMQRPASVDVTCKRFTLNAETVEVIATGNITEKAQGTFAMSAQQDLSLTTQAKLTSSSMGDTEISATGALKQSAALDASLSGMNTKIEGQLGTTISGGTTLDLKSLQITAAADAKLDVGGPMTMVGKNLTTITGQLVSVDAPVVKLG